MRKHWAHCVTVTQVPVTERSGHATTLRARCTHARACHKHRHAHKVCVVVCGCVVVCVVVCVCVCVCACARASVRLRVCASVSVRVCACICVYLCVSLCVSTGAKTRLVPCFMAHKSKGCPLKSGPPTWGSSLSFFCRFLSLFFSIRVFQRFCFVFLFLYRSFSLSCCLFVFIFLSVFQFPVLSLSFVHFYSAFFHFSFLLFWTLCPLKKPTFHNRKVQNQTSCGRFRFPLFGLPFSVLPFSCVCIFLAVFEHVF